MFKLGRTLATPGALIAVERAQTTPIHFLRRHAAGDWSEMDPEDAQANRDAVRNGSRILSEYRLNDHTKLWVITEADRSATTLLLPSDY